MSFDWRKTLSSIAPIAGTMLGGPFGAIAGKAIGDIFGHTEENLPTELEISEYIQKATPEQLVKLKELDSQLKIRMKELDISMEQLSYSDTADARSMQKSNNSNFPALLCTFLTVGFFGALYGMMTMIIPEANKEVVYLMVGSLGTAWVGSIQFWVGTTKGSSDKNNMLAQRR